MFISHENSDARSNFAVFLPRDALSAKRGSVIVLLTALATRDSTRLGSNPRRKLSRFILGCLQKS